MAFTLTYFPFQIDVHVCYLVFVPLHIFIQNGELVDVEGDPETIGKTAGKDAEANKPTYVKLLGLDGAKAEADRLLQAAIDALDMFGESADQLRELALYIVERDR